MRQVRGYCSRYFLTVFLDSPTLTASTIRSLSLYWWLIFSTNGASALQKPHQVVQNSTRTTLPLIEALEKVSPLVDLAVKRGAGSFCLVLAAMAAQAQSANASIEDKTSLRTRLGRVGT